MSLCVLVDNYERIYIIFNFIDRRKELFYSMNFIRLMEEHNVLIKIVLDMYKSILRYL
jgi:hypothetical protein